VHRFFAADDPDRHSLERREMAAGLLHRHRVEGALDPAELLEMSERLRRWVREQFGRECIVRSEWPLSTRLATGTAIVGASDFIVENTDAVAVIDHKSFGVSTASAQVDAIAGQLDCYAGAVARARPGKAVSTWVHLPFAGVIVEVC